MNMEMNTKIKSMATAVIKVMNGYPSGLQYHGNELHNDVASIYPEARRMYTDTIMRAMRRHCHFLYKTVDQNRSLYEKV